MFCVLDIIQVGKSHASILKLHTVLSSFSKKKVLLGEYPIRPATSSLKMAPEIRLFKLNISVPRNRYITLFPVHRDGARS